MSNITELPGLPRRPTTADLVLQAELLVDFLLSIPDDATDEQVASARERLYDLEEASVAKVEALYHVLRSIESRAERYAVEEKRLQRKRKRLDGERERVRSMVTDLLEADVRLGGEGRLTGPTVTASLQRGCRVEVDDLDALAAACPDLVRHRFEANRTSIRADLDKGREVPGCRLAPTAWPRFS